VRITYVFYIDSYYAGNVLLMGSRMRKKESLRMEKFVQVLFKNCTSIRSLNDDNHTSILTKLFKPYYRKLCYFVMKMSIFMW